MLESSKKSTTEEGNFFWRRSLTMQDMENHRLLPRSQLNRSRWVAGFTEAIYLPFEIQADHAAVGLCLLSNGLSGVYNNRCSLARHFTRDVHVG